MNVDFTRFRENSLLFAKLCVTLHCLKRDPFGGLPRTIGSVRHYIPLAVQRKWDILRPFVYSFLIGRIFFRCFIL